jgi:hypothetical protein
MSGMANNSSPSAKLDRYLVIHVATTCDEHGVYVTKDSAEVIELGWMLLDTKTCDEVRKDFCQTNKEEYASSSVQEYIILPAPLF